MEALCKESLHNDSLQTPREALCKESLHNDYLKTPREALCKESLHNDSLDTPGEALRKESLHNDIISGVELGARHTVNIFTFWQAAKNSLQNDTRTIPN